MHAAKCAGVFKDENAIVVETKPNAGVVGAKTVVGEDVEVAGHAEVDLNTELV